MNSHTINFISTLTFRKILNILKVKVGYLLSIIVKRPVVWGLPYSYAVEPTSHCNLRCHQCPTGLGTIKRSKGEFSIDVYRKFIDQIASEATYLMLYLQGEPFINPKLFDMIKYASVNGIYTCTSTNGHFLSKKNAIQTVLSGLDRIIISIDGTTQEVYEQYRKGGDIQMVITSITNLVEAKRKLKSRTPYIILQFIVFKHNEHQISDFEKLGKKLHVNKTEVKSAQIYNVDNESNMITDIAKYSRYQKHKEGYRLKRKLRNSCRRIFTTAAITHDGNLLPCCYDKDGDFSLGNINTQPLAKIWNSQSFNTFRQKVLVNRQAIEICRNCNEYA